MSAVIIILLCLCAHGTKIAAPEQFNEDYLSPHRTNCIKGFFVLMVFVSHFRGYVTLTDSDSIAVSIVRYLGQLMVAPFLFYSGYGIMESIQRKGFAYVKQIPVQRAIKTLIHFDIAVLLFLIVRFFLGKIYPLKHVLLALAGWTSLGNSNWYIFAIVSLYFITAFCCFLFRKNKYLSACVITGLSILLCRILSPYRPDYCYNTILCYVLGVWYSLLHDRIEKIVMRRDILFFAALAVAFAVYHRLAGYVNKSTWIYQLYAMLFMILLVGISMKIEFSSPFLDFLGKHVFSIYILQRIPMMIMNNMGIYAEDNVTFFILSFLLTCILALAFDSFTKKFDALIFRNN